MKKIIAISITIILAMPQQSQALRPLITSNSVVLPSLQRNLTIDGSRQADNVNIFQSLYFDREGKDLQRIKEINLLIEDTDLEAYRKLATFIQEGRFYAIDEGLLKKVFPFFEVLDKLDDHGTTSLGHTLEVYDAYVRIVTLDENNYHSNRQITFEASNNLSGLRQEARGLQRRIKVSGQEADKQKLEELEMKLLKLGRSLNDIKKQKISLTTKRRLRDLLSRLKMFKRDSKNKELFYLLPILHDVGKMVKSSGHAEIGARYFVRPILEKLGFDDEQIEYAKTIIWKHVDISTVITTERTPEYLRQGENGLITQEMMDILTILSLADRSYGDRAHRMNNDEFDNYLEWGDLQSARWEEENNNWHLVRLARYLKFSSLDDSQSKIEEMIAAGHITEKDALLFQEYMGSRIKVFDYADAVFQYIVDKDATGRVLVKLLVILSKMAEKYGDDIYRINLFKKPEFWLEVIYKAADEVDVKLSPHELEKKLSNSGLVFSENTDRFLNVAINVNPGYKSSSAGLEQSELFFSNVDINIENENKIGPIKAVIFDWDNTVMWERNELYSHQIRIILEIWYGKNNYGKDSSQWKLAEAFYYSTLGIGCEQRFQNAMESAPQGNKSTASPEQLADRLRERVQAEMQSQLFILRNNLENELVPGVLDFIRQLRKLKVPIYIVTANSWLISTEAVRELGFDEFVDGVYGVGSPEFPDFKKEDVFNHIRKKYSWKPEEVLVVGDSETDILAAKTAGMKFLAVVHDEYGKRNFQAWKADAILPIENKFIKTVVVMRDATYLYTVREGDEKLDEYGEDYSLFKLGDPDIVQKYAIIIKSEIEKELGEHIRKNPDAWRIVLHIVQGGNNASGILSKKVAEMLGIRMSIVETPDPYLGPMGAKGYAAISSGKDREKAIRGNHKIANPDSISQKNIIFIDDSVVSGSNLNEMRRIHQEAGTASFQAFVLFKLESADFSFEDQFNKMKIEPNGVVNQLIKLLTDERFIYINSCIRCIFNLEDDKLNELLERVSLRILLNLYVYGIRRNYKAVTSVAIELNKRMLGQAKFLDFDQIKKVGLNVFNDDFDELISKNNYDIPWEKVHNVLDKIRVHILAHYFKTAKTDAELRTTGMLFDEALRYEGIKVEEEFLGVVIRVMKQLYNDPFVLSEDLSRVLDITKEETVKAYSILQKSSTAQLLFSNKSDYLRHVGIMKDVLGERSFWKKVFDGQAPYPLLAEFHLALQCNKRCPYCWSLSIDYDKTGNPLSEQEIVQLIEEFSMNGVKTISINGGKEPLMNPLSLRAIEFAKQRGLYVMLVTNGVLLNKKTRDRLISFGVDQVRVSLDTINPEIYQEIYDSNPEECNRIIKNLQELVILNKQQPAGEKTSIGIGVVVHKRNYDRIFEICEFASRIGLDFIDIRGLTESKVERYFTDEELSIIGQQGKEAKRRFGKSLTIDFREESFRGAYLKGATRCWKSTREVPINPYGVISNCALASNPGFDKNHAMGNVRDTDTFGDLWKNTSFHRENIKPEDCKECHYGDAILNIAVEKFRRDELYGISLEQQPFLFLEKRAAALVNINNAKIFNIMIEVLKAAA
jgi:radical SAM protein with 4Fe4S-binding SPASM domain